MSHKSFGAMRMITFTISVVSALSLFLASPIVTNQKVSAAILCGNSISTEIQADNCDGISAGVPYPSPLSNFFEHGFHVPYRDDGGFGSTLAYPSPLSNLFGGPNKYLLMAPTIIATSTLSE